MWLLDLSYLPFSILLIASAFIFCVGLLGNLNMKFFSVKTTQIVAAIGGAVFALLYFFSFITLVASYLLPVSLIHYTFFTIFIVMIFVYSIYTRMVTFHPVQIVGMILFGVSAYFLLA
jgi:hypothetical protein